MLAAHEIAPRRKAAGLSLEALGLRAGVCTMTVARAERGTPVRPSSLLAIAVALDAAEHPANLPPAA